MKKLLFAFVFLGLCGPLLADEVPDQEKTYISPQQVHLGEHCIFVELSSCRIGS